MEFTDVESQLEGIREIFKNARTEDEWNLEEDMLYSYYFVDKDVDKLEKLGLYLDEKGYDFIDVFELGDEETGESTGENLLHIDKVEINSYTLFPKNEVEPYADVVTIYTLPSYFIVYSS